MKRRHRLSGRLILLFLLLGLLIALTVRTGFRYGFQDEFRNLATPHLMEYVDHLRREIGNPPNREAAAALAQRLDLQIAILSPNSSWSSHGVPADPADIEFHRHRLSNGQEIEAGRNDQQFMLRLKQDDHTLLLSHINPIESGRLPLIISLTIIVVLLIIALAYHLVRRLFRPIETIRQGVTHFGEGDLGHRIAVSRRDELGELANSINTMAEEIQQMLESKRQLLLAISHELRSPLTRARVNAELIDESEPQKRIIDDLQQMEAELTELLETERLGSRHARLDCQPVSPKLLIDTVVQKHFDKDELICHHDNDEEMISLDAVRVKLMLRNLLENALRHTPEGIEPPTIDSLLTEQNWEVSVTNGGQCITAEHLPHLTEPFYRADKARQRETGGYGLGLYLCQVIAQAHGGSLSISSEKQKGTSVRVIFPRRDHD
ncbi:MAG: HAMP domain-containing histidine kinase [Candidatus Thiodiazotropha sp. (ex Myrtea sp. 'scaly one' KF741663)]|nr:HAMP domain-containing histidine kinase [Candidatus Thiodiazotropha sp. (ex Myrtea sp. 'scaly one' KF741663)]